MGKIFYYIKKCRLCNGEIKEEINFGKVAIGNDLSNHFHNAKKARKLPLSLNRCRKCNHFQLGISINPKILYAKNYTYLSGIGSTFIKHFDSYSNWILKKITFKDSEYVLDIGSNDGTCLNFFKRKGINTLGIDPAKLASDIAKKKDIKTINKFFDNKTKIYIERKFGKPFLITSHNVLAHIEDIQSTFKLIYDLLQDDGYFCFEVGYFKSVIENKYLDTIYHEHLDYHHANPLVKFLNKIGFSILDISLNKIQGGSIRILAKKSKFLKNSKKIINFCNNEKKSILYNKKFFNNLIKDFFINSEKISLFIKSKKDSGIVGFGSPTKAVLLNKLIDIDYKIIKYTLEDNLLKTNKYLPTSCIPIFKNSKKYLNKSVSYYFIYAWNFGSDILKKLKKNKKYLNKNAKVIIPLPTLKIRRI